LAGVKEMVVLKMKQSQTRATEIEMAEVLLEEKLEESRVLVRCPTEEADVRVRCQARQDEAW
jgi:hypothetical protein